MIIYNFFKYLVLYIQYYKVLVKTYREDDVVEKLSKTFETRFKIDWVGRMYTIFNPNIKNGVFDRSNPIYSYNEQGLNTDDFVKQYILTKLSIIDNFVNRSNLFELVTYDIKKLDNYDNYLFIIKPLPCDEFIKYCKLIWIPICLTIAAIVCLFIFI